MNNNSGDLVPAFYMYHSPVDDSLGCEYGDVSTRSWPRFRDYVGTATGGNSPNVGSLEALKIQLFSVSEAGLPLKSLGSFGYLGDLFIKDTHYITAKSILGTYGSFHEGRCFDKKTRKTTPVYLYMPNVQVDAIDYDRSDLWILDTRPKGDPRHVRGVSTPVLNLNVVRDLKVFRLYWPFDKLRSVAGSIFSGDITEKLVDAGIIDTSLFKHVDVV